METLACVHTTSHSIGKLCICGDWARAHGDFEALRHIAQHLGSRIGEPLHCDLVKLAELCLCDLDAAGALWDRLKVELLGWNER